MPQTPRKNCAISSAICTIAASAVKIRRFDEVRKSVEKRAKANSPLPLDPENGEGFSSVTPLTLPLSQREREPLTHFSGRYRRFQPQHNSLSFWALFSALAQQVALPIQHFLPQHTSSRLQCSSFRYATTISVMVDYFLPRSNEFGFFYNFLAA